MKFTVDRIEGACPTQADGHLGDGRPFYFNARHGDWSVFVGPAGASKDGDWIGNVDSLVAVGDDPSEGRMSADEVRAALHLVLDDFA